MLILFTPLTLKKSNEVGTTIITILQGRKRKPEVLKQLAEKYRPLLHVNLRPTHPLEFCLNRNA